MGDNAELILLQGNIEIMNNDSINYENSIINKDLLKEFTIKNTASIELDFGEDIVVKLSGIDVNDFVLNKPNEQKIATSGEIKFSILFSPVTVGQKSVVLKLYSTKYGELFTLNLTGDVGDLEIAKYFDDLIVKIYYSR